MQTDEAAPETCEYCRKVIIPDEEHVCVEILRQEAKKQKQTFNNKGHRQRVKKCATENRQYSGKTL